MSAAERSALEWIEIRSGDPGEELVDAPELIELAARWNFCGKRFGVGGAERDRTVDLLNAIQALSQLSYGPTKRDCSTTNAGYRSKFHDRRANSTVPHSPREHDSPFAATLPKWRVFCFAQFAADAPAALLRSEEN